MTILDFDEQHGKGHGITNGAEYRPCSGSNLQHSGDIDMKYLMSIVLFTIVLAGCTDATIVSHNLSKAAEQFEIDRRIVFYNGITGEYMLVVEGRCSVEHTTSRLGVTCKVEHDRYKKHYLGLSDNVTYFSEQVESAGVDKYHYKVIFKPAAIIPDVDIIR